MTLAERPPFVPITPEYERAQIDDVRNFLRYNTHLLPPLHAFFDEHCASLNDDFDTVLALGELAGTIIAAHCIDSQNSNDPDAYLVKQYDVQSAQTYDWEVAHTVTLGRGDSLERTLVLFNSPDSAKLKLSGRGSEWLSDNESGLLKNALLLPHQAQYDIGKTATTLTIVPPA